MPGYGDVVDLFDGTFNHHLSSATCANEYGDDLMVLEIYVMRTDVIVAVTSHEFVDLVLPHGRPGFLLRI